MIRNYKRKRSFISVCVICIIALFSAPGAAVPPATQFMPGFPILAGDNIMIMWLPVPGAAKYVVYINDKKAAEGVNPPIQVPTPAESGDYRIQVAAVDASGAEGPKSSPSVIKIAKLSPPADIEGRFMAGNIALRWKGSSAAVIYNVFRSEEKGKNYKLVNSTQMSQYVDSAPAKDKTFYYVVTAKDIGGRESAYSPEVVVSTKAVEDAKSGGLENQLKMVPTKQLQEFMFFGSQTFRSPVDIVAVGDKLFVANGADGTINVIGKESGDFIAKFGGNLTHEDEAKIGIAFGMGADRQGRIYVCAGNKVVVFDESGKVIKVLSPPPPKDKEVLEAAKKYLKGGRQPSVAVYDMAEAADGSILIVDNGFARILVYDPVTFEIKKEFGRYGSDPGEFNHPGLIAVNKDGDIWVNDSMNRRAQVFKSDYTLKYVTGEAKTFVGSFLGMGGAASDEAGNFVITDPPMTTIQAFNAADGKYLYHFAGEDLKVDEKSNGQRPFWTVKNPAGVYLDAGKKLLYICSPQTDEVLVRQILK